jgi:ferrous iron transport protein A
MKKNCIINQLDSGKKCRVVSLNGDGHFLSRIIAIGLTPGCEVEILRNKKKQAMLLYARDTMIALAKKESEHILIEEI